MQIGKIDLCKIKKMSYIEKSLKPQCLKLLTGSVKQN